MVDMSYVPMGSRDDPRWDLVQYVPILHSADVPYDKDYDVGVKGYLVCDDYHRILGGTQWPM